MPDNLEFNRGAIDPAACIGQTWELIKGQYALFFVMTMVAMLVTGVIPFVHYFLYGPIFAGFYYALQQRMHGHEAKFEHLSWGLGIFVPAMLIGLLENLINLGSDIFDVANGTFDPLREFQNILPAITGTAPATTGNSTATVAGAGDPVSALFVAITIGLIIITVLLRISFALALPLLSDHPEMGIGGVIRLSIRAGWANAKGLVLVMIFQSLITVLGVLAFCVGILFVLPIIFASDYVAYRMVFPDIAKDSQFQSPPAPDFYSNDEV